MFQLCSKLKSLKGELHKLNNEHFSDLPRRVVDAREQLEAIRRSIQVQPLSRVLFAQEAEAAQIYCKLSRDEESFYKHKSKVQWLELGDQNSSFFFRAVKGCQSKSRIRSLTRDDGSRMELPEAIRDKVVDFYNTLWGRDQRSASVAAGRVTELFEPRLSVEQSCNLGMEVSDNEIKHALFSIKDSKAPGPDGYNTYFFKKAWLCGESFLSVVKSFLNSGRLLKQVSSTAVALIPKIPNASNLKDFRPISCCNVVYKCITKVIANRLKEVMSDLVGRQ